MKDARFVLVVELSISYDSTATTPNTVLSQINDCVLNAWLPDSEFDDYSFEIKDEETIESEPPDDTYNDF